jgi:formamidopyrimidine-DNA glycosylase
MPELPEVETQCADLRSWGIIGERIDDVRVFWHRTVAPLDSATFKAALSGRSVTSISRRGKYIHLALDDGAHVLAHLRMTGSFTFRSSDSQREPYDRLAIFMGQHMLVFRDPRKFGRVLLVGETTPLLGSLGPEPFDPALDSQTFHSMLASRRVMVKTLLLDQRFLAGLGNIYADESLYGARIHPCRLSNSLSLDEASRLLRVIRELLEHAIANRGTSLGDGQGEFISDGHPGSNGSAIMMYGRRGDPCPRCATPIVRITVGQRSTHYCPSCQT